MRNLENNIKILEKLELKKAETSELSKEYSARHIFTALKKRRHGNPLQYKIVKEAKFANHTHIESPQYESESSEESSEESAEEIQEKSGQEET